MKLTITLVFLLSFISLSAQNIGVNITVPESTMDIRSKSISEPSQLNISNQDKSRYVRFFSGSDAFPDPSMSWYPGMNFLFATYDDATFTFTEYMRIDDLGNVGIGITNPTSKLEVNGGIKANSLDINSGLIKNVADPISTQDAATKAYVDATSSPIYTIGFSNEQGGYIFWVSSDGKHGLVAETYDQATLSNWYEAQNLNSKPSHHTVDAENFRDWRMPTKYELNEMYLQKDDIGGFSNSNYWSSTEYDNTNVWKQSFLNGDQTYDNKAFGSAIRAVRAF